jgi:hypothetical protein
VEIPDNTPSLSIVFESSITESETLRRIRKYFTLSNYQEIRDSGAVIGFKRTKTNKKGNPLKNLFLEKVNFNAGNRTSWALIEIIPEGNKIKVKIKLDEIQDFEPEIFTQEILVKELTSFKRAVLDDVFVPVEITHSFFKYILSFLASFFVAIAGLGLWLGIFFGFWESVNALLGIWKIDVTIVSALIVIVCAIISTGLVIFSVLWLEKWRKRQMHKKINSIKKA